MNDYSRSLRRRLNVSDKTIHILHHNTKEGTPNDVQMILKHRGVLSVGVSPEEVLSDPVIGGVGSIDCNDLRKGLIVAVLVLFELWCVFLSSTHFHSYSQKPRGRLLEFGVHRSVAGSLKRHSPLSLVFRHFCKTKFIGALNEQLTSEHKGYIEKIVFCWLLCLPDCIKIGLPVVGEVIDLNKVWHRSVCRDYFPNGKVDVNMGYRSSCFPIEVE
ncbi:hypothetical protein LR48_Vigan04g144100 [Vigna angularis]|uniref:Uncharacterized protein n=1 Tax=Phaseolus angularis TaxID=3914 RepID=A0A0L9UES7_PHAAN|nr:hypothetical protein LR48_Vigan04g144100 [Vigna angularis]